MNKAERDKDNPHCIHYDNQLIFVHGFNEEETDSTVGEITLALNCFGDMLEALKAARGMMHTQGWHQSGKKVLKQHYDQVVAAIEKAEKR